MVRLLKRFVDLCVFILYGPVMFFLVACVSLAIVIVSLGRVVKSFSSEFWAAKFPMGQDLK